MLIITARNIDIQNINQNCCVSRKRLREKSIRKSPKPKPFLKFLKPYINISKRLIATSSINPESRALGISSPLTIEFSIRYNTLTPTKSRVGVCGIALYLISKYVRENRIRRIGYEYHGAD
jgi:hypothetical protein